MHVWESRESRYKAYCRLMRYNKHLTTPTPVDAVSIHITHPWPILQLRSEIGRKQANEHAHPLKFPPAIG